MHPDEAREMFEQVRVQSVTKIRVFHPDPATCKLINQRELDYFRVAIIASKGSVFSSKTQPDRAELA